jgi:hypothetical protein
MPHLFTHSFAHSVHKFDSCNWEKKEERGALLSGGYSLVFGLLSWLSILRKFCRVFSPMSVS